MKKMKGFMLSLLFGVGISSIGASGLVAQESNEAPSENIEKIVTEARKMAEEWAVKIREWKSPEDKRTTYMGISIEAVPDVLRDYIDLPKGIGLLLSHISKDSPAEKAGLMDNDILVSFGGQLVVNFSQLSTLIDLQGPGAEVLLKILRKGEEMELTVILEERIRRGGTFMPPEAPNAPEVPSIPDSEDVGVFMEQIEEWLPGSVSIFVDENEKVHVNLQDLKENFEDLRVKIERLKKDKAHEVGAIKREYGDYGARTSVVHVDDRTVNYTSRDGKLVLTSSSAGEQAIVWDSGGQLIYQGDVPDDFESQLPQKAVELIRAYNISRDRLRLDSDGSTLEIQMNDEIVDPVTMIIP